MAYFLSGLRVALARGLLVLTLALGGCASNGDPRDPLEPLNRVIYHFNDGVDHLVIIPAAELYQGRMVPQFVRTGVRNFFSNINDVIVALNSLLQGKLKDAESDLGRIVINTTAGILGFFDVATDAGLEKHNEDFGQSLGVWGLSDGPYLVLPFLGPSSFRDAVGWVGDIYTWPITYIEDHSVRNSLIGLRVVSRREELLAASRVLEAAALDPYQFTRDAYLQRRRNLVYDGNPPPEENEMQPEPKPKPGSARSAPVAAPSAGELATPAEREVREREAQSQPLEPAHREPRVEAAPGKHPAPRVVRVWLPASR